MRFGEFVERLGVPIEDVLDAYCAIQISHPSSYDYLNPGCSEEELRAAELRLGQELHPLHHVILRRINGGSEPNIGGAFGWWAAAVPREEVWRPAGPVPPIETVPLELRSEHSGMYKSRAPWVMGQPSTDWYSDEEERRLAAHESPFLPFAAGAQSGELFGYRRGHPTIEVVSDGEPLTTFAADFEAFLRHKFFCLDEDVPIYEKRIRAALAGEP